MWEHAKSQSQTHFAVKIWSDRQVDIDTGRARLARFHSLWTSFHTLKFASWINYDLGIQQSNTVRTSSQAQIHSITIELLSGSSISDVENWPQVMELEQALPSLESAQKGFQLNVPRHCSRIQTISKSSFGVISDLKVDIVDDCWWKQNRTSLLLTSFTMPVKRYQLSRSFIWPMVVLSQ